MTIKLHYKSVLTPLQQILWTCCIFLSSINNTFFSVLVIILSNMSYFCFNYKKTFFIYTMSYFSVVLRIMFSLGRELFFAVSRIYFWAYNALRGLQLKWTGSSLWLPWATILKTLKCRSAFKENAEAKHCQGKKRKRFSSFLQNLSGASSLKSHGCVTLKSRNFAFWVCPNFTS